MELLMPKICASPVSVLWLVNRLILVGRLWSLIYHECIRWPGYWYQESALSLASIPHL